MFKKISKLDSLIDVLCEYGLKRDDAIVLVIEAEKSSTEKGGSLITGLKRQAKSRANKDTKEYKLYMVLRKMKNRAS